MIQLSLPAKSKTAAAAVVLLACAWSVNYKLELGGPIITVAAAAAALYGYRRAQSHAAPVRAQVWCGIYTVLVSLAIVAGRDVHYIGARGTAEENFLDWGLEKDLLLPFREQTVKVHTGDQVLVSLYLDKSSRLCATMKVYPFLKTNSPYAIGDTVDGLVYEISGNFGVFVAVDNQYSGLIPKREAQAGYRVGQNLKLRVTEVKEDGKLTLSARGKAYEQIREDSENVLQVIREFAGVLPFDDKASPEVIQREFGLSKAAFKRAVGRLLKEKQVELRDGKIWMI